MKALRRSLALVAALVMLLSIAAPALGYHDPNVRDLRIRRLDPVQCGVPITLEATVWRRGGGTVSGVVVDWSFIAKGNAVLVPGDTLTPTTSVSDANGRATTELTLVCEPAKRIVQGEHPSDAADRITIECNQRKCAPGDQTEETSAVTGQANSGTGTGLLVRATEPAPITASNGPSVLTLLIGLAFLTPVVLLGIRRGRDVRLSVRATGQAAVARAP